MEGSAVVFLLFVVILVLALIVVLITYWIFKLQRNRGFTILEISAGQPDRLMTVKVEPDHAQKMLDHLLDRVFLNSETEEDPGGDPRPDSAEGSEGEAGASRQSRVSTWINERFTMRLKSKPQDAEI